ncbi:hypothetical protein Bca4012_039585 [Brassica carinata]|uniref:Complex III subunit 9 n=1 Tax=Brassica carinata TaxID=52824 RepID=A0A8X8B8L3_BRACI|nr:hypothetical protein Bca52824_007820 [Brassica carinata]
MANQKGALEGFYRLIMRRNSVYVSFIIAGAFFGERAVDYGVHKLWESKNVGKRYEDISVLGQRPMEE